MPRQVIHTEHAPAAIGTYSQAILVGNTLYLSGQIGLDPYSMELVEGIEAQIRRVFDNLKAVCVVHEFLFAGWGFDRAERHFSSQAPGSWDTKGFANGVVDQRVVVLEASAKAVFG